MVANKSSSPSHTIARESHKNPRDKRPLLPAREVHRRLKQALADLQRAERNAVLWFAEVVRRKLYKEMGYSSIHQYAEVELGFGMSKTSQFLRLAGSLEHLPQLRRALARGEIPWTTAREVATVATPRTEGRWIAEAKEVPRRVLETRTAQTRRRARAGSSGELQPTLEMGAGGPDVPADSGRNGKGEASKVVVSRDQSISPGNVEGATGTVTGAGASAGSLASAAVDPATPMHVSLRMTAEQYARYQALLDTLRKQKAGVDAVELVLASLEQAALAGESSGKSHYRTRGGHASSRVNGKSIRTDTVRETVSPRGQSEPGAEQDNAHAGRENDFPRGKSRYRRSPYQVIVHTCPSCNRAAVPTNRGEGTLTPHDLRTILCDARIRVSGGRNTTPIPERVRRAVMERDRHRCRAAGCGRTSFLAVHHKVPREAGGRNTLENLITLCSGCHRALHGHA